MITLELAQKLKAAGLKWEPKKFDLYNTEFIDRSSGIFSAWCDGQNLVSATGTKFIWLPSLSQLIVEIKRRGYSYNLYDNYPADEHRCRLTNRESDTCAGKWSGGTPEDAAASALLWILEREKDE
ncbi:MAG: hypothetical protein ACYDG4_10665 [Desulfuromonadaceae bacterium]